MKAILVGSTQLLPVRGGAPLLGRWQRIFFCEFDGPRSRELLVVARATPELAEQETPARGRRKAGSQPIQRVEVPEVPSLDPP